MINNVFDWTDEFKNSLFLFVKGNFINVVLTDEQVKLHNSGEYFIENIYLQLKGNQPATMHSVFTQCDAVFFITGKTFKCRGPKAAEAVRGFINSTPLQKANTGFITTNTENLRIEFNKVLKILSNSTEYSQSMD